jgi:hypothetical protein
MSKYDGSKFKWSEIFSNPDGKSSGSGFIGIVGSLFCMFIVLVGMAIYVTSLFTHPPNIAIVLPIVSTTVVAVLGVAGLYAGLLGLRKWKTSNEITSNNDMEISNNDMGISDNESANSESEREEPGTVTGIITTPDKPAKNPTSEIG